MRYLLPLALLMGLSACASEETLLVSARPIQLEASRPADPSPVSMLPVGFRVVTRDNINDLVSEINRSGDQSPVFIVITSRDYENMVLNLADLRRYIEQQQSVIAYYRGINHPR